MTPVEAPSHLKEPTREWFSRVTADYELEGHHIKLLTLAAESWDACQDAREAIAEHGSVFVNRHGEPRPRPEVKIFQENRIIFARLMRELNLDSGGPEAPHPPGLKY